MKDKKEILTLLRNHKSYLKEKYGVSQIGLFGSYARGDTTDKSDVDILVEFERPVGLDYLRLASELEELIGMKVDLVTKKGIKQRYLPYVEKDLEYA